MKILSFILSLLFFAQVVSGQAGPDYNTLKRLNCSTSGEIRDDDGDCVTLSTYFSGKTLHHVGSGQTHATIGDANAAASTGDVIVIHAGTYRESVRPPVSDLTYVQYPGDEVYISGAIPLNQEWTARPSPPNVYVRPWVEDDGTTPLPVTPPDCPTHWGECNRHSQNLEILIRDKQIMDFQDTLDDMTQDGQFHVNGVLAADGRSYTTDPDTLYAYLDQAPANYDFEYGIIKTLFWGVNQNRNCANGTVTGTRVIGLTFRHSTNNWNDGAVCGPETDGLYEEVVSERNGGVGFNFPGKNQTIRGLVAIGNGLSGINGGADSSTIAYVRADTNAWRNTKSHEYGGNLAGVGAAGSKWTNTYGSTFTNGLWLGNESRGLWFDVRNEGNTVEGSIFDDNLATGLMLETGDDGANEGSYNFIVKNNVFSRTRFDDASGHGWGLLAYASKYNTIVGNIAMLNDRSGMSIKFRNATTGNSHTTDLFNNLFIANNVDNVGTFATPPGAQLELQDTTGHRLDGNIFMPGDFDTNGDYVKVSGGGLNDGINNISTWRSYWQDISGTGCDQCAANDQFLNEGSRIIEDVTSEDGWKALHLGLAIDAAVAIPDSAYAGGWLEDDIFGNPRTPNESDAGPFELSIIKQRTP